MKFCVIGPTYPYRGGIAHFTTMLVSHLRRSHDVSFYSFSKSYPRLLFPGNPEKDPSTRLLRTDCEYLLRPLNPFTWLRALKLMREERPEVVVLQWWVPFWTPMLMTISSFVKRFTASKILFICHHISPPDGGPFDLLLARNVLLTGDYFIVMSDHDYAQLRAVLPRANIRKAFLPTYDMFDLYTPSREEAKRRLGISNEEKTVLFFGFVRRYKGLRYLIEAMPEVLDRLPVRLLIVGEFWEEERFYMEAIDRLGIREHVSVVNAYVPNEEVGLYFAAANVVVLPYLEATQSGVLQMAYAFGKPVIVTSAGGLAEVVRDGETGLVVPPKDSSALTEAIVRYFEKELEASFAGKIAQDKDTFAWINLVNLIEQLVTGVTRDIQ